MARVVSNAREGRQEAEAEEKFKRYISEYKV
jgi:hypothetical protein